MFVESEENKKIIVKFDRIINLIKNDTIWN